jgi:NADPH:quinone reductase-like Zn-dependent oxidoreductase
VHPSFEKLGSPPLLHLVDFISIDLTMPSNNAAIIPEAKVHPYKVSPYPYSPPSTNELVVRTHALAINPADWVVQKLGVLIAPDAYPAVVGCDVAGEIIELGPGHAENENFGKLRVGDRVVGQAGCLHTKDASECQMDGVEGGEYEGKKIYSYSGFQEYVVLRGPLIVKIPDEISYEDAVVLPLALVTAASCLFPAKMLGLDVPTLTKRAEPSNKILLVWAASSSVGSAGVQLAHHAGYTVIGICSTHNHSMVLGLGATKCFDQSSSTIEEDVITYITQSYPEAEIVGAYDGISTDKTVPHLQSILTTLASTHKAGVKKFIATVSPFSDNFSSPTCTVKSNISLAADTSNLEDVGNVFGVIPKEVFGWVGKALGDGILKCAPPKDVLGHGLESLQGAVDKLAGGTVSGRKLVVTI